MAATISVYGDQLTTVALLVLLYRVTGSIQAPAVYLLAKQVPRILGGFAGGDLADRFTPQRVVALCSLLQGAAVGGIVLAGHRGSAATIYGLVMVGQLGAGMARAAMGAVMPRVVPADDLPRANALYQLSQNTAYVGAPLLGAPLLAWRGPDPLLLLDVGTFLIAAAIMLALPTTVEAPVQLRRPGPLDGVKRVASEPLLRILALTQLAEGLVVNVAASVFVLLANERLGGDGSVALLYLFVGVGDAIGGLFALRVRPKHVNVLVVLVPGLVSVGSIAFLAFAHHLWSAALPLIFCGAGAVVFQTWGMAEAQRVTSRDVMGRVSAVLYLAQAVGLTIGAAVQIVVLGVTRWDIALPIISTTAAALLAVAAAVGWRTSRSSALRPPVTPGAFPPAAAV